MARNSDRRFRRDRNALREFAYGLLGTTVIQERHISARKAEALALEHGLVVIVTATQPCGPDCECKVDGFPAECIRLTRRVTGDSSDPPAPDEEDDD